MPSLIHSAPFDGMAVSRSGLNLSVQRSRLGNNCPRGLRSMVCPKAFQEPGIKHTMRTKFVAKLLAYRAYNKSTYMVVMRLLLFVPEASQHGGAEEVTGSEFRLRARIDNQRFLERACGIYNVCLLHWQGPVHHLYYEPLSNKTGGVFSGLRLLLTSSQPLPKNIVLLIHR